MHISISSIGVQQSPMSHTIFEGAEEDKEELLAVAAEAELGQEKNWGACVTSFPSFQGLEERAKEAVLQGCWVWWHRGRPKPGCEPPGLLQSVFWK